MVRLFALVAALVAAVTVAGTASASSPGWRDFGNADLNCSIGKPGTTHGSVCIVTNGTLEGWSVIMGDWGIEVQNAAARKVFAKHNYSSDGYVFHPKNPWPLMSSGVMCNKTTYTVACMVIRDKLAGFAFLLWGDGIEVTNMDGRKVFKRGSY